MSGEPQTRWELVEVGPGELDLDATLASGQAFRWVRSPDGRWAGPVGDQLIEMAPCDRGVLVRASPSGDAPGVVRRFLALDVPLAMLMAGWGAVGVPGLRVVRQEPEEALFAFMCACCNNVPRITRSVRALARLAGSPLGIVDGVMHYAFPSADRVAGLEERALRAESWGFRARRLLDAAAHIAAQGDGWFESLRSDSAADAVAALMALPGIGRKIADCIRLFGLAHDDAVPVDTHIYRYATANLRPDFAGCSLTPRVYAALADAMCAEFGEYAGWAQQHVFYREIARPRALRQLEED